MRKIIKRILLTLLFEFISLIIVANLSFFISRMVPGDPILPYLPTGPIDPDLYDQMRQILGLDQPIFIQFFRYLGNMLTGNWGFSFSILRGYPTINLISERIFPTIYLMAIPLIIGLFLGYILGNHLTKVTTTKGNRIVQTVSLIGFILPIMTLTILSQSFLSFINPIFDLVILWVALSVSITAISTLLVRMYFINLLKKPSERHSTNVFVLLVGLSYGIVLAFLLQTEMMFSFDGVGDLFLLAFSSADYYTLNAIIFLIFISFPIFIVCILFIFFLFGRIKRHHIRKY